MFYFLNKNRIFQYILLGGMFLLCLYSIVFQPIADMVPATDGFLYSFLHAFFCGHPIFFRIITLLLLLTQLVILQLLLNQHGFLENNTLLPSFWFLFFYFFTAQVPCLSTAIFTSFVFCLILFLILNSKVKEEEGKKRIFYCALFAGSLCLVDMASILLLPYIFIVLIINNIDILKKFILTLIGFSLPFLYLLAICFLTNHFTDLLTYFRHLQLFGLLELDFHKSISAILLLVCFGVFVLYALPSLKRYYDNKLIVIREKFAILYCLFIMVLLGIVFENFTLTAALPYLSVPLSFFAPMMCQQKHGRLLHDLVLLMLMSGFVCFYFIR